MREIKFRAWDKKKKKMYYETEERIGDHFFINVFIFDKIGWSLWKVREYTPFFYRKRVFK